jgi:hypothetical protein
LSIVLQIIDRIIHLNLSEYASDMKIVIFTQNFVLLSAYTMVTTKDSKANQSLNYYEDIINQGINEN